WAVWRRVSTRRRRLRDGLSWRARQGRLIDRAARAQEEEEQDDRDAQQDAERDSDRAVARPREASAHVSRSQPTPSSRRQLARNAASAAVTTTSSSPGVNASLIRRRDSSAWAWSASSWTRKYSLPVPPSIP